MKRDTILVDADFCIKLGGSAKYPYLLKIMPLIAEKIYIHEIVYDEILSPRSAKEQVDELIERGYMEIFYPSQLDEVKFNLYQRTYELLGKVMLNPRTPKKNNGETHSLSAAKTLQIPYFYTDEKNLQPIIDRLLNTGITDNISCIRIRDLICDIREEGIEGITRKDAKIIWVLAGYNKHQFDSDVWPL